MTPLNRKLTCNRDESHTHDTTHHAEAAYQNHSHGPFPSFSWRKFMRRMGRTDGKTYMPDAYRQGHKNGEKFITFYH